MQMTRQPLVLPLLAACAFACAFAAHAADPGKVLRLASPDIETLDAQQYADDPSFQVLMAIFEPLYEWDYLASPPKLSPLTAAADPEVTDGGRTWTIRLKKGTKLEWIAWFDKIPDKHSQTTKLGSEDRRK